MKKKNLKSLKLKKQMISSLSEEKINGGFLDIAEDKDPNSRYNICETNYGCYSVHICPTASYGLC